MATNSFSGINDDIISQMIMESFQDVLNPLGAFSTSFNSEAAQRGDRVSVGRIPTHGVTQDFTTVYTMSNATMDAIEIVLTAHKFISWSLKDTERIKSSILELENFTAGKGQELAEAVLLDVMSLITEANFGAAILTITPSSFDADTVLDVKQSCNTAKMPKLRRSLILEDALTTALYKDNAIQDASASGTTEPLREGSIGRVGGFDIRESWIFPTNSEDLVGIAAHPMGMGVAMRYLPPQAGHSYNVAQPVVHPETGLTLGRKTWFDPDAGEMRTIMECLYGFALGITAGIKRIASP